MKNLLHYSVLSILFLVLACDQAGDLETSPEVSPNITFRSKCVSVPSGLVAWLDGDAVIGNTAFDIQNTHDGTLVNGVTTSTGFIGNAFSFDGNNDYIIIPDSKLSGVFESGNDFTINLWANKTPNRPSPFLLSLMTPTFGCNEV